MERVNHLPDSIGSQYLLSVYSVPGAMRDIRDIIIKEETRTRPAAKVPISPLAQLPTLRCAHTSPGDVLMMQIMGQGRDPGFCIFSQTSCWCQCCWPRPQFEWWALPSPPSPASRPFTCFSVLWTLEFLPLWLPLSCSQPGNKRLHSRQWSLQ